MHRLRSLARVGFGLAVCTASVACRATSGDTPDERRAPSVAPTAHAAAGDTSQAGAVAPNPARAGAEWAGTHALATHVGTYTLRWRSTPDLLPLAENFALDVWVFAASAPGVPLADVTLDVDAGMPQHGHGLARRPRIARVGPGHWRAEGLRFHMPGRWELFFDVTRGARLERAQTSVVLE